MYYSWCRPRPRIKSVSKHKIEEVYYNIVFVKSYMNKKFVHENYKIIYQYRINKDGEWITTFD